MQFPSIPSVAGLNDAQKIQSVLGQEKTIRRASPLSDPERPPLAPLSIRQHLDSLHHLSGARRPSRLDHNILLAGYDNDLQPLGGHLARK